MEPTMEAGLEAAGVLTAVPGPVVQIDEVRIHEAAAAYGCVGLTDDMENLHCPLCEQNK